MDKKLEIVVGIDCGTKTGFATWNKPTKRFIDIKTMRIDEALFIVREMHVSGYSMHVVVEDARKRKWFGNAGREQLQGAGSIKRDSTIWSDFLIANNIPHTMKAPAKGITKLNKVQFEKITGYKGQTSEHARDAAMLVYQY